MKIPVKDAVEASDQAPEPAELVVEKEEADMAEEPAEMTEEEMVEAAIRAGEEAADNDFKLKYEKVEAELAELREQLAAAEDSKTAAEAKAADAVSRHARLQADWENYRRRTAQERLDERARATEKLVEALLPVVDDMERALDHARSQEMAEDFKQFVDGVDAVRAKLLGVFDREGVEPIDPKGEAFDCNIHQAVGRVEDASQYDETVNDVYQKGYRMGGKVLRPAMVTVTYGGDKRPVPAPEADAAEGQAEESAE